MNRAAALIKWRILAVHDGTTPLSLLSLDSAGLTSLKPWWSGISFRRYFSAKFVLEQTTRFLAALMCVA